jgi:hypothetical protein
MVARLSTDRLDMVGLYGMGGDVFERFGLADPGRAALRHRSRRKRRMFTIKHIDESGDEFAIEAASYSVKRERRAGMPDLIRVMTYDTQYQDQSYSGLWAGIPPQGGLNSQTIFVMNQHGATVSKICFEEIPQSYWELAQVADVGTAAQAA